MFTGPVSPDDEKIKWAGSQADFISLVDFFEAIRAFGSKKGLATTDEIGELFLKVIDIDLSPYPDFHTMRLSMTGSSGPQDIAKKLLEHVDREDHFADALEGTGVEESLETKANNMLNWMMTHDFIKKLSKHIDLPDK